MLLHKDVYLFILIKTAKKRKKTLGQKEKYQKSLM